MLLFVSGMVVISISSHSTSLACPVLWTAIIPSLIWTEIVDLVGYTLLGLERFRLPQAAP